MHTRIRIATRKSPLALCQAGLVAAALRARFPELRVETVPMTTRGDTAGARVRTTDGGGKGLFVRELERGLFDGRADIAVHSMKDLPAQLPGGLVIAAMMAREDASDVFVCNAHESPEQMPDNAVIGTASLRRRCQIRRRYPRLSVVELHGNVGTRLEKLDAGEYDGLILAGAGLKRLGLAARIRRTLPHDISLPAAGQGAIGIECRDGDDGVVPFIHALDDAHTRVCVETERALARRLGADCRWPLAAHASLHDGVLRLRALVGDAEGRRILHDDRSGAAERGAELAAAAAEALLSQGAGELLAQFAV